MPLLNLVLDDDTPDGFITALYQVGPHVLTVRQNPEGGQAHAVGYEELPPEQSANPLRSAITQGSYVSNTPNVGWLVWSSTFVLAEYLLRRTPQSAAAAASHCPETPAVPSNAMADAPATAASWHGVSVLELGAGVGVLGVALAKSGADVTITDLAHITPLTHVNVMLNFDAASERSPCVVDYQWNVEHGEFASHRFHVIVAADCVYEPQYYQDLLSALDTHLAAQGRVYCCYKRRRLRQELFEKEAVRAGWRVAVVPDNDLEEEFRGGEYRLLVLSR